MRDGGFNLGGEQSGHVIFADHATTGDGLLTGLQLAAQVALTGRPLKDLATVMTKLPQLMINVKNVDKARAGTDEGVLAAVAEASEELGETGRVLLRPSGTEALVRVMVEAADMPTAERICKRLAAVVEERLAVAPAV
jgi:phosphoglucosamine mutase